MPRRSGSHAYRTLAAAVLAPLTLAGCGSTQEASNARPAGLRPYTETAEPAPASIGGTNRGQARTADPATDWALVVGLFRPEERRRAEAAVAGIRQDLPGVRLEDRGPFLAAVVGYHKDPGAPEAKAELARVREITRGEKKPYAGAVFAPPLGDVNRPIGEHDLRRVRQRHGDIPLYTLQVAAYGPGRGQTAKPADMEQYRRAAEQAVAVLRQKGADAYYYHGPNLSMVTVGVFGTGDYDPHRLPPAGYRSPRLEQTMREHPEMLVNGMPVVETHRVGDQGRTVRRNQRSVLVRVPD